MRTDTPSFAVTFDDDVAPGPVTAWECSGHTRCRTLVYEPGGYCLACETDIRDAWEAAL